MSLLAASTTSTPSVTLHQHSNVISSLGPLVDLAVRFQRILGSVACLAAIRLYLAAGRLLQALWFASYLAAFKAILWFRFLSYNTAAVTRRLLWAAWDSKQSRRIRRKLEFEFFVLILGPGNALLLLLFWPGWLLVATAAWAFWPAPR
ncbi:hypothetical protein QBC47DRAFT_97659 [Echria macrotheca]|uniref:Uncharacterized protein n=1 Tax=Echria macrotheca TaxID=438768 RepID=A0AAJ0F8F0_9PEZI|nr:hypothetical protein QBC47DRAFT_97659 [Echria macrotheca]